VSPSLDEAAAELYAVEPSRFTAERTRLTGEARTAGDADTAKVIGELRRPTTSAWLVNQLVRGEQGAAEEVGRLDQLGHDLREAQATLDAVRMRELTKQRHQLVGALVRRADDVAAEAGQKVSAAVRRELEDTLGAVVADEQASLAVMSGRLTRALTYAGFGEVDITEATATPLSSVHPYKAMKRSESKLAPKVKAVSEQPAGQSAHPATQPAKAEDPAGKKAEKLATRRTQAEELVSQAGTDVDTAQEALRLKERELDEAASEQAKLQTRLDALQAEVIAVRRELDASDRQVSHTERDVQRHERQLKDAVRALSRAEAALDRLDPS
jgi:chromosome segregation ATPase